MVRVDGKQITENMLVSNKNHIQISAKNGMYTPTKENTRIWLYNKPRNLVCTHYDTRGRETIFKHIWGLGLRIPHIMSVGRLDYLSEGLMILTNDGDLVRALELPSYRVER